MKLTSQNGPSYIAFGIGGKLWEEELGGAKDPKDKVGIWKEW